MAALPYHQAITINRTADLRVACSNAPDRVWSLDVQQRTSLLTPTHHLLLAKELAHLRQNSVQRGLKLKVSGIAG